MHGIDEYRDALERDEDDDSDETCHHDGQHEHRHLRASMECHEAYATTCKYEHHMPPFVLKVLVW